MGGANVADGAGEIAEAIEELRAQLTAVQKRSADERLRFVVTEVEMEFLVTVTKGGGGAAGIQIGLVHVGANGKLSKDNSHKLTLKLEVRDTEAPDGRAEVSDRRADAPDSQADVSDRR
jgi:Trypsin-co-occurring domain 2